LDDEARHESSVRGSIPWRKVAASDGAEPRHARKQYCGALTCSSIATGSRDRDRKRDKDKDKDRSRYDCAPQTLLAARPPVTWHHLIFYS
jgi:hypothetical protein